MTSDSRTYVPHNLKGLLSSEQDPIIGVLQYHKKFIQNTIMDALQCNMMT
jgi:hypothetical protein